MERASEATTSGRVELATALPLVRALTAEAWALTDAALKVDSDWDRLNASEAATHAERLEALTLKLVVAQRDPQGDMTVSLAVLDEAVDLWRTCKSRAAAAGVDVLWDEGDER